MKSLIYILTLLITLNTFGQKEDVKYASFNILSGGITSSAIACFNKPKNHKLGKTFINAFWKGCLGGSLNYTGKKLIQVSSKNNTYAYVWPGRIVNSLGSSMIYNGAKNEKLLYSISMNVFFTRLSYDGKLHCQIDPITLGSAVAFTFTKDMSFNFKNTLVTGSIIYSRLTNNIQIDNGKLTIDELSGKSLGNTFFRSVYTDKVYYFLNLLGINVTDQIHKYVIQTTCHELIHTFQYSEYNIFNTLYLDKIKTNLTKYINVNANFGIVYLICNSRGYKNNPFERGANYFGYSIF
jgi:hypothetical protein